MNALKHTILGILISTAVAAGADQSELKLEGDLMVHPSQVADFFKLAADEIKRRSGWDWPAMGFTKPYKTSWTNVQAKGPFQVKFGTERLSQQEVEFELEWNDPLVSVGRFEIADTIERVVGGARIIIHLDGACSNMVMRLPQAGWKVKGRLAWTWTGSQIAVQWQEFQFSSATAQPAQVDLGQCEGPTGLHQSLKEAIEVISQDQAWMQDVLKDGVLNWVEGALGKIQSQLMEPRTALLKPGLELAWQPSAMSGLASGLIRVAGHVSLRKEGALKIQEKLERGFSEASLEHVKDSGFVLPKDTLPKALDFLYRTGELQYRVTSDKIDSFQGLMQSRFLQFFVWPDLMKFNKRSVFYFDVRSEKAPVLSGGSMAGENGVVYNVQAPLLVNQWAPHSSQYFPYVDFRSQVSGQLYASVKDGELVLRLKPYPMSVGAQFRGEYSQQRPVTPWIATSLLGSRVQGYLSSTPFKVQMPTWTLGEGVSLGVKGIQIWKQSFRVPLEFRSNK